MLDGDFRHVTYPINRFYTTIHQRIHQSTNQEMFKDFNRLINRIFYCSRYLIGNWRIRVGLIGRIVTFNSIESCISILLLLLIILFSASLISWIGNSISFFSVSSLSLFIDGDWTFLFFSFFFLLPRLPRLVSGSLFITLRIRLFIRHFFIINSIWVTTRQSNLKGTLA